MEEEKKVSGKLSLVIKSDILQRALKAVSAIDNDTLARVNPDGIHIIQIDKEHISMVDMVLSRKSCESYNANSFMIAIDLDGLLILLKLSDKDELVNLEYDESKENRLIVSFGRLCRRLSLLDKDHFAQPKIPDIAATANITVSSSSIHRSIRASEQLDTDFMKLTADGDSIEFSAEDDTDSVSLKLIKGTDYEESESNVTDKSKSMYDLGYLKCCLSAAKNDEKVKIAFSSDTPIIIDYVFDDDNLKLKYLIAPRIESE